MKSTIKFILKNVAIVLVFSIIGYFLLSAVYSIPTDGRMTSNVKDSIRIFESEGEYPMLMSNYNSRLDNWTDAIMILEAVNQSEDNPFIASLKNNYSVDDYLGPVVSLLEQNAELTSNQKFGNISYARYWHGYLVILKPLLWLFSYGSIRSLLGFIEILLLILVIKELFIKAKFLILPFVCTFLFFNPVSAMLSMQFAWVTILMLLVSFLMIKYEERLNKKLHYYFTLVGCLTSYLDLLTFPMVSLTVPLILYLGLNNRKDINELIKTLIICSFSWVIGYAGVWVFKWVLASILTDIDVIADGIAAFVNRTSHENAANNISYISTVVLNLGCSFQISWFSIVLYYLFLFCKKVFKSKKIECSKIILYIIISLYPFIWCIAVMNHSYAHCWFTYRIFGTCVFAFTAYISLYLNIDKTDDKESLYE